MTAALLDANVLFALATSEHPHRGVCTKWFNTRGDANFATCAITEGALLQFVLRTQQSTCVNLALALLRAIQLLPGHVFIDHAPSYLDADLNAIPGHRQLTDA